MPSYILYFGYPIHWSSADLDDAIIAAVGHDNSGCGTDDGMRDLDFQLPSLEACQQAVQAAQHTLPPGSKTWILCYAHENDDDFEIAIPKTLVDEYLSQLDAASLDASTRASGMRRAKSRL